MLLSFPLLLLFQNSSQVGDDVTNAGRLWRHALGKTEITGRPWYGNTVAGKGPSKEMS